MYKRQKQKGTPLHDATVIGDTVGDPFKDTSSVALNPVIKFTTLFGLLATEIAVTMKSQGLKTGIGAFFFIVALAFVYRSFYAMRIPEEHTAGANSTPVVAALQQLTTSIPIVCALVTDPVGLGFVKSLSHPGGNITGFLFVDPELLSKWTELLKNSTPGLKRAGVVFNPATAPFYRSFLSEIEAAQQHFAGLRRFGAATLDLAWIAAGRLDVFWERDLSPWDLAAGILLVREAGGFVSDLDGGEAILATGHVVAGNETMHRELLRLLKAAGKEATATDTADLKELSSPGGR